MSCPASLEKDSQAVLLITFGGPTKKEEIRPFLDIVLQGRPTPRERVEEVVRHYEALGGASPIYALTRLLAEGLKAELAKAGAPLPVYVGMRNWHPFIKDVMAQMAQDGVRHAIGLILAAHRSEASVGRYKRNVDEARVEVGDRAPHIEYVAPWHDHPLFIDAL